MQKDGIFIFTAYLQKFERLNAAQFGTLIRSLLEYQETGNEPEIDDIMVGMAFDCARVELDAGNAKREQISALRREAGRKGGEAKPEEKGESKQTEAKTSKSKQNEANESKGKRNINININKNINDSNKKEIKEKSAGWVESEELNQAIKNFIEHRKLMKKPMTAHAIDLFIKKLQKLAPTEAQQIALINKSIEKGWLDVYADDKSTDPPKAPSGKLAALEQYYLKGGN